MNNNYDQKIVKASKETSEKGVKQGGLSWAKLSLAGAKGWLK